MYLSKTSGKLLPRCLVWIVAGFLVAAGVVAQYIYSGYAAQMRHAQQLTREVAALTANNFATIFAFNDSVLMAIAQTARTALPNPEAAATLAKLLSAPHFQHYAERAEDARHFYVFDRDGQFVASSNITAPDLGGISIKDRHYFQKLRLEPAAEMVISDVVLSRLSHQNVIILARSIWSPTDETFLGVVLTQLSLDFLVKSLSQMDLGRHAITMIRRNDTGQLLARHPFDPDALATPLSLYDLRLKNEVDAGNTTGTFDYLGPFDDAPRVTSYSDLKHYPVFVSVAMAYSDILEPWRKETLISVVLLVAAAMLTAFGYGRLQRTKISLEQKTLQAYKLSAMVEQCPVALAVYDESGFIEYLNPKYRQMTGISADLLARSQVHLVDPVISDKATQNEVRHAIQTGQTWSGVIASRRQDSTSAYWQSMLVAPIKDGAGHIRYYLSVGQDITEQYLAQQALAEREHMLSAIYDASSVAIFMLDHNLTITRLNKAMANLFERDLESMVGLSYLELVHPDQRHLSRECLAQLAAGTVPATYVERKYLQSNGSTFWGDIGCRRLHTTDGSFVGLVAVLVDITDRKQVYSDLASYRTKLRSVLDDRQHRISVISEDIAQNLESVTPGHEDDQVSQPITSAMASLSAGLLEGLGENAPSDVIGQLGELVGHLKDILDKPEPAEHKPREL